MHPYTRTSRIGILTRRAMAFICLATLLSGSAMASSPHDNPAGESGAEAPYRPDPSFNFGNYVLDKFPNTAGGESVGVVTALLENGDIVVAGLVPEVETGGPCSNGTALCALGLVRYNQAGSRVAWANPGSNGHTDNQYIIYVGETAPRYQYIRDIKVSDGKIYVLLDEYLGSGSHEGNHVSVAVFATDGSHLHDHPAFGDSSGLDEDYFGAQLVLVPPDRMLIVATGYDVAGSFIALNRAFRVPEGLYRDVDWGTWVSDDDGSLRIKRLFAPGGYCGAARCNVVASYATAVEGWETNDFYIGASVQVGGNDWDPIAVKISSVNGELKPEFNGTGWSRAIFNEPNSSKRDVAAGIFAYQNQVYLAAQVARKCDDGIGMAKLDGTTGQYITSFAGDGTTVFGGVGNAPFCILEAADDVPTAIATTAGRIGIVGYGRRGTRVDPLLAVVDAADGSVIEHATHPVLDAGGARVGDGVLYSIVGGPDATSPFTVGGNGRVASTGNRLHYLAHRFVQAPLLQPVFGDGFE